MCKIELNISERACWITADELSGDGENPFHFKIVFSSLALI